MTTNVAPLSHLILEPLVRLALEEDLGRAGDITSDSVIPFEARAKVVMASRQEGVIAGLDAAEIAFKLVDSTLSVKRLKAEGAEVKPGDEVMEIEGRARSILTAERVALNFVGRMSGIATLTNKMVKAVGNHPAKICSTRKTTPGLRAVEKYAVKAGGGANHRLGLDDAILIKDNHIAIAGGVAIALRRAKENAGHMVKIEIEVDTLEQLKEVLEEGADVVMLDNMSLEDMTAAVKMVNGRALVEASGGVTLERIPKIAATGVDMISTGALTHSAPNFDVGLDFRAAA
ncbi:MAG: carboxylating nicotinate-nucleotide diphosphorylase [Alphaproteobacteria bacterium]|nr:carboxylating nicotinate-nucleotide diphosphorylase [Alphaproteobacteria bacterium]